MRLGIDAHRLLGSRAGVARVLVALLDQWARTGLPFERVTLFSPAPLPAGALPREHPFETVVMPSRLPVGAWQQLALPRAARDVDVLFSPNYVLPLAHRGRSVVMVFDALHELFPETFPWHTRYRRRLYRASARRADLVLACSESTRRDLERLYRLDASRLRTVPLGYDELLSSGEPADERAVRERYGLGDAPLVLFVGKFSRRRHLPELVRAFAATRDGAGAGHTLVLVGQNPLELPIEKLGAELGLNGSLRVLGHVPDADLRGLYRAARIFVYPSGYEGFGLPVLEAMAAGIPVVTLDNSSLREVAEDVAVLLPSGDPERLAGGMASLMSDPALRRRYAEGGRARAKEFPWARTAQDTMDALAEVARRSPRPAPAAGQPREGAPEGSPAALGLPDDYYDRIFEVEQRHWWHRGMRSLSAAMLGERLSGRAVLDAGCGTGGFLAWAMREGGFEHGSGIDVSPAAIELARRRVPDADLHVAPVAALPFADDSFDLVTLNDVLQHIPEDDVARSLSEIRRVLRPGGALLVRTGGARRARRERADWRVYDRRALARELERGGLRCLRASHVNLMPSLASALRGRTPRAPTHESHGIPTFPPGIVAAPAGLLLRAEAALVRRTPAVLPYGHTLMALAVPASTPASLRGAGTRPLAA